MCCCKQNLLFSKDIYECDAQFTLCSQLSYNHLFSTLIILRLYIFFLSPALSFPFFLLSFILPLLFNLLSLFTFSSLKLHWGFYLSSTVAYSGVELKRPRPLTVLFWWPRFSCSLSHPHPPLSSSCPPSLTPSYNSPSDCYEWGINSSCSFNQWGPLVLSRMHTELLYSCSQSEGNYTGASQITARDVWDSRRGRSQKAGRRGGREIEKKKNEDEKGKVHRKIGEISLWIVTEIHLYKEITVQIETGKERCRHRDGYRGVGLIERDRNREREQRGRESYRGR